MIKARIFAAVAIFGALLLVAANAHAARYLMSRMVCGNKAGMIEMVKKKYGEEEAFSGLFPDGGGMQIYVNPNTKSYTIFMDRKGDFCMVASGSEWGKFTAGDDA